MTVRKKRYTSMVFVVACLMWAVTYWGSAQDVAPEVMAYADMVVYKGKILTADDSFHKYEALAVRDGKFLGVGDSDRILKMAGPQTRRIDLKGKTVVPGFIETHSHGWIPNIRGASREEGEFREGFDGTFYFNTLDAGLQKLGQIVAKAKKKPGEWVRTSTIRSKISTEVTARDLDQVSPDNPVVINISPQSLVLNSKGLDLVFNSGFMTPDLPGVLKDAQGKPTGQFRGLAFGVFYYEYWPWPDMERAIELEKERHERSLRQGSTTLIGRIAGVALTVLNELRERGELRLRARVSHEFLSFLPDAERFFKRMGTLVGLGDDWLKIIGTVPQQVDGGSRVGAILTKTPKLRVLEGAQFGSYGKNYWEEFPEDNGVDERIALAGKYGWNITSLHSYGDRAAEMSLEAFERGMKNHPPGLTRHRWVLDHNWMHDEETIAKMKELNVLSSILVWFRRTPRETQQRADLFNLEGQPLIYMYGADNLSTWSQAKSLIEAGLKPMLEGGGSTPLEDLQLFITRKGQEGRIWGPAERVSRQEALWMKTAWAARYTEEEDKLGTIEAGKLADFVVLGGDYLTVPEDAIYKIPVLMTVVGGKVMFEEPGQL